MMSEPLSRFEDQIQRLVEGGFARLFAGRLHPREVAIKLARVLEDNVSEGSNGQPLAPSLYVVDLNPIDHETIIRTEPDLAERLADELAGLARAGGISLAGQPKVQLRAVDTVLPHDISIRAQYTPDQEDTSTQTMPPADVPENSPDHPDAFLLTEDNRQILLQDTIINIGRHRDNSIILGDPQVSRHHAQLRLRFGRYVLFDLASKGGTSVNGIPIHEVVLQSGDVVDIAGNKFIYVEEDDSPNRVLDDTQAFPPLDSL